MDTMSPHLMSPGARFNMAFSSFMDHTPSADICEQCGIEEAELRQWVTEGNWIQRRTQITEEAVAQADARLRAKVIRERMPVVEAQLGAAEKIVKKADKFADEAESVKDLGEASRALKTAADVQSRILGLDKAAEEATSSGKSKIIFNVFGTPAKQLPADPVASAKSVDAVPHD